MLKQPLKLYWRDQLIGHISEAAWSDFPWALGKVSIVSMQPELREAMEYLHRESYTEDGVTDWPYPEEFVWDWSIVDSDGETTEIGQPIIDFNAGEIEWC